jgi:hypothetical protein
MAFRYFITHRNHEKKDPRGLFAYKASPDRIDIVGWNNITKEWEADLDLMRFILKEDQDRAEEVPRQRAEEMALELWMQPLPSEPELERITDETSRRRRRERGE